MGGEHVKGRPYIKAMIWGVVSVALYVTLLTHQEEINANFANGGMYAFLPIAVAFLFSIVHGSFTGHFWSALGVEASKKKMEVK